MRCPGWTARLRHVLGPVGLTALTASGCASPTAQTAPAQSAVPQAGPIQVNTPPDWRPGDRWVYAWTSDARSGPKNGMKNVEVVELWESQAIYLVKVGDIELFYTKELQWAGSMRDGKVQARMTPPQPWFVWPLEAGRHWTHRGTYEDTTGKSTYHDRFSVVGAEVVEVPAGRFNALKVVRETDTRDADQYWYAPEVRFYVKWIGRRGGDEFEEVLREYRPAPRLIPGGGPARSPSTPK